MMNQEVMTVNIIQPTDQLEATACRVLIYGEPFTGKTSIGFSSKEPLLLNFDGDGLLRTEYRLGDAVTVESWADVAALPRSGLIKDYETVVVDTVGGALVSLSQSLILNNPRLAMGSGALTLQGYGELKDAFMQWANFMSAAGVDLVFLAHSREERDGEGRIYRPDIQGGSKEDLLKLMDHVGFLHTVGTQNVLSFNKTDKWYAKNTAKFPDMTVPHLDNEPLFLAGLMEQMKAAVGKMGKAQADALASLQTFEKDLKKVKAAQLDGLIETCREYSMRSAQRTAWGLLKTRAAELKYEFDKDAGKFKKVSAVGESEAEYKEAASAE